MTSASIVDADAARADDKRRGRAGRREGSQRSAWVALALSLGALGCSGPGTQEVASVDAGRTMMAPDGSAPDAATHSARLLPDCNAIRRCLRTELPARYESESAPAFYASAARCLGERPEQVYAASSCLPLTFGHDAVSGRALQIAVKCSDVCPMQTKIWLTYEDQLPPDECLCVGGQPRHEVMGNYVGCAPSPARQERWVPIVKVLPQADGSQRFLALGGGLGIPYASLVKAIDGRPVRQSAQVERMLAGLPNRLPRSVTLGRAHYGPAPKSEERTVYFVPQSAIEALVTLRDQLGFRQPVRTESCRFLFESGVTFGGHHLLYANACRDPETAQVRKLAAAIRRSARLARAHDVPVPPSRDHCRGIDSMPTHISTWDETGRVDLIYADWLAR